MSQSITRFTGHTGTAALGSSPLIRLLLVVAVLSAAVGSVATAALDRVLAATAAPQQAPVASWRAPVAVRGDTSVPEASAVFAGREVVPEEPAPTF
jgi:hypothetical protein